MSIWLVESFAPGCSARMYVSKKDLLTMIAPMDAFLRVSALSLTWLSTLFALQDLLHLTRIENAFGTENEDRSKELGGRVGLSTHPSNFCRSSPSSTAHVSAINTCFFGGYRLALLCTGLVLSLKEMWIRSLLQSGLLISFEKNWTVILLWGNRAVPQRC